jgi:hypothetical protein
MRATRSIIVEAPLYSNDPTAGHAGNSQSHESLSSDSSGVGQASFAILGSFMTDSAGTISLVDKKAIRVEDPGRSCHTFNSKVFYLTHLVPFKIVDRTRQAPANTLAQVALLRPQEMVHPYESIPQKFWNASVSGQEFKQSGRLTRPQSVYRMIAIPCSSKVMNPSHLWSHRPAQRIRMLGITSRSLVTPSIVSQACWTCQTMIRDLKG